MTQSLHSATVHLAPHPPLSLSLLLLSLLHTAFAMRRAVLLSVVLMMAALSQAAPLLAAGSSGGSTTTTTTTTVVLFSSSPPASSTAAGSELGMDVVGAGTTSDENEAAGSEGFLQRTGVTGGLAAGIALVLVVTVAAVARIAYGNPSDVPLEQILPHGATRHATPPSSPLIMGRLNEPTAVYEAESEEELKEETTGEWDAAEEQ
jgi:hypothetical protein